MEEGDIPRGSNAILLLPQFHPALQFHPKKLDLEKRIKKGRGR
jgi:hypothetical protein